MTRYDSFYDKQIILNNAYIDCNWSNFTFGQLVMRIGAKITRYRFIGGQASWTRNDHIINGRPDGFYNMIISCITSWLGKVGIILNIA